MVVSMQRMLALAAASAVLAGCGGGTPAEEPRGAFPAPTAEERPPPAAEAPAPDAPDPVHVHGLGLEADGTLLIATHNGLFRLAPGGSRAEVVGETRHDLMGFTVAGRDRLLASGHPDLRGMSEDGLPPHLGLVESLDGGETWRSVSLLGEADFHALRVAGEHVYGFDATHGRLLASTDGGATWEEREADGALLDLVVDPADPEHLLATGERGLQRSRDGGRSWQAAGQALGLLAWPDLGRLYLVDPEGRVLVSSDGEGWKRVGELGGRPAALLAAGSRELYAARHDGTIVHSADGGESWTIRLGD
jgi:photosystem II stability/assembly factor-like uncharacterized protein